VMARYPSGFGRYLGALDFHLGPTAEFAFVWPSGAAPASADPLLEAVFGRYLPRKVVAGGAEGGASHPALPLLADRPAMGGRPTAYMCRRYVCQMPVTSAADLARQIEAGV